MTKIISSLRKNYLIFASYFCKVLGWVIVESLHFRGRQTRPTDSVLWSMNWRPLRPSPIKRLYWPSLTASLTVHLTYRREIGPGMSSSVRKACLSVICWEFQHLFLLFVFGLTPSWYLSCRFELVRCSELSA